MGVATKGEGKRGEGEKKGRERFICINSVGTMDEEGAKPLSPGLLE